MPYTIQELQRIITPIARQHGVESVSVFGSYSKGNASSNNNVDLKIERGQLQSLFQIISFRLDVKDALHLLIDLVTSEASNPAFLKIIEKMRCCFIET